MWRQGIKWLGEVSFRIYDDQKSKEFSPCPQIERPCSRRMARVWINPLLAPTNFDLLSTVTAQNMKVEI